MHKIEKGEDFWIARREQFYLDKGLIYLPQRLVSRDLVPRDFKGVHNKLQTSL